MASEVHFIRNPELWEGCLKKSHMLKDHAEAAAYEKAIILPLEQISNEELPYSVLDTVCRGGVCDADFNPIAGHRRRLDRVPTNLDCWNAYSVDESQLIVRHERVVFGGILYEHFGHTIADTFSRIWYLVQNPDFEKVVFVRFAYDGFTSYFDPFEMLRLLNIPSEKIEVIRQPTQFDEVIVPEEAFISFSGYIPEFRLPFQEISKNVATEGTPSKVYLSRRAYQADQDNKDTVHYILNEEYFEDFFFRRGFEIVYPEQLSVREQISIIFGADEIVGTIGTMTHLLLFAKSNVKATILIRETPMFIQANIDQACGLNPYYVDVSSNPLPVDHAHGPYIMLPNRFFKRYLEETGIEFTEEELNIREKYGPLLLEFASRWAEIYRQPHATDHHVSNETMFDLIRRMNDYLYDETFEEADYRSADSLRRNLESVSREIHSLREKLDASRLEANNLQLNMRELEAARDYWQKRSKKAEAKAKKLLLKNEKLQQRLQDMRNTASWRLTKPLRVIKRKLKEK